jgi:hypothetical protein
MMKIIQIDNFNRDEVSDILVCEGVTSYYGEAIVAGLNEQFSGDNSSFYFRLVLDEYVLYKFEGWE